MAHRRRNIKDLLVPEPTPDRKLTHPSGWCMTNYHNECKYQFDHGKCGCDCHIQKTQKKRNAATTIMNNDDPRPWKNKV